YARANDDSHRSHRHLCLRKIELMHRIASQTLVLHVAHDADDLTLLRSACRRETGRDVLSYRVASWKESLSECLVDDDDWRRLHVVAISEVASLKNRNAHRAEVSG